MVVRPLWSGRGPSDSTFSSTIAVLVSICAVIALIGVPIAAGTGDDTAADTDSLSSITDNPIDGSLEDATETDPIDEANETDAIDISLEDTTETDLVDELPENETIELIVRLEDPSVDEVPATEVEDELQDHADRTQDPLIEHAAETPGLSVEEEFWLTNAVVVTIDTDDATLEPIADLDSVERVHENFEIPVPDQPQAPNESSTLEFTAETAGTEPATQQSSATWGIDYLNAPDVWDAYDTRGDGVRVAVLDTGVDASHPDIDLYTEDPSDPTYPGGWAEFNQQGDRVTGSTPYDSGTHGTHVSGTVAGGDASGTQIGVAPDVELLHGLVLSETSGSFAQVVAGMEWAVQNDADIINMSLGTEGQFQAFVDPVTNARDSGTIVVGAIGNEGYGTSGSPGNVYETLSIGAVNNEGTVAPFSGGEQLNRTDWRAPPASWPDTYTVPDLVAPGVSVKSAVPENGYSRTPGTSMATPHVSGTIALMLAVEPDATPAEIESALIETAWMPADPPLDDGVEPQTRYGHGIVDASAAVAELNASGVDPATADQEPADSTPIGTLPAIAGLIAALLFMAFRTDR